MVRNKKNATFVAVVLLMGLFGNIGMQSASAQVVTGTVNVPSFATVSINGAAAITCLSFSGCYYSTTTEADTVEIDLSGLQGPGTVYIADTEGDDSYDVQGSPYGEILVVIDGEGNDYYSGNLEDGDDNISINDATPAGSTQPSPIFGCPATIPLGVGEGDDIYEFHGGPGNDQFEGVASIICGSATLTGCNTMLNNSGSDRYILYGDKGDDTFCSVDDGDGQDRYTFSGDDGADDFDRDDLATSTISPLVEITDGPGHDRYSYNGGPGVDSMNIDIDDDTGGDRYSVEGAGENDSIGFDDICDSGGVDRYLLDGGQGTDAPIVGESIYDMTCSSAFNIMIVLGFP